MEEKEYKNCKEKSKNDKIGVAETGKSLRYDFEVDRRNGENSMRIVVSPSAPNTETKERICPACGAILPNGYYFCPECGYAVGLPICVSVKPTKPM